MYRERTLALLLALVLSVGTNGLMARSISTRLGDWKIVYNQETGAFTYKHRGRTVLSDSQPEATYRLAGKEVRLSSADCNKAQLVKSEHGDSVCFVLSPRKDGSTVRMEVAFSVHTDALLTRLDLTADRELSSNHLAPIRVSVPQQMPAGDYRMLKVPFDNDDFVRYHYYRLDTLMLSYEVTGIFDITSRKGIVIGSVSHDHLEKRRGDRGPGRQHDPSAPSL